MWVWEAKHRRNQETLQLANYYRRAVTVPVHHSLRRIFYPGIVESAWRIWSSVFASRPHTSCRKPRRGAIAVYPGGVDKAHRWQYPATGAPILSICEKSKTFQRKNRNWECRPVCLLSSGLQQARTCSLRPTYLFANLQSPPRVSRR